MQEDAAGLAGGSNLYAYAEGRVLEAVDPDGLYAREVRGGEGHGGEEFGVGKAWFANGLAEFEAWSEHMDQILSQTQTYTVITYADGSTQRINAPMEMVATVLAEDPFHGAAGFDAVASVIMNRVGRTNDAQAVIAIIMAGQENAIQADNQFDAVFSDTWSAAYYFDITGNSHGRFSEGQLIQAASIADDHFTGRAGDTTGGATNFFSSRIPTWAQAQLDSGEWEIKSPDGLTSCTLGGYNIYFGPR